MTTTRQIDRATARLFAARADFEEETRWLAGTATARRTFKRDARRASRRASRAIVRAALSEV